MGYFFFWLFISLNSIQIKIIILKPLIMYEEFL